MPKPAVVLGALVVLLLGLIVWGVADGRVAARPWELCSKADKAVEPARKLAACDQAIARGRLPADSLSRAYSIRGRLRQDLDDHQGAIADFDKILSFSPYDPYELNGACWARAVAGVDLDRARTLCDEAIERLQTAEHELYPEVMDSRGLVGLKQGKLMLAYADYDTAADADPKRAHYLYGRGLAARALGRAEEAESDLRAALAIDPKIAETYAGYGVGP